MNKNLKVTRLLIFIRSLLTGFFGGLIWSSIGVMMYYFNFTEVDPKKFILRPLKGVEWTSEWQGDIVTIIILAILSIIVAAVYFLFFKRIYSIWMGIIYGIITWMIVFFLVQPLFPNTKQLLDLNNETIISTICLFVLYGTFIGYSISYDYYDTYVLGRDKQSNEKSLS